VEIVLSIFVLWWGDFSWCFGAPFRTPEDVQCETVSILNLLIVLLLDGCCDELCLQFQGELVIRKIEKACTKEVEVEDSGESKTILL
jgi:hypothetical protein